MIILYFLISIPFIALYVLQIKVLDYVSEKKWNTLLFLLQLLSSFVLMGSVFLGNMAYTFIYVYKHNRVLW